MRKLQAFDGILFLIVTCSLSERSDGTESCRYCDRPNWTAEDKGCLRMEQHELVTKSTGLTYLLLNIQLLESAQNVTTCGHCLNRRRNVNMKDKGEDVDVEVNSGDFIDCDNTDRFCQYQLKMCDAGDKKIKQASNDCFDGDTMLKSEHTDDGTWLIPLQPTHRCTLCVLQFAVFEKSDDGNSTLKIRECLTLTRSSGRIRMPGWSSSRVEFTDFKRSKEENVESEPSEIKERDKANEGNFENGNDDDNNDAGNVPMADEPSGDGHSNEHAPLPVPAPPEITLPQQQPSSEGTMLSASGEGNDGNEAGNNKNEDEDDDGKNVPVPAPLLPQDQHSSTGNGSMQLPSGKDSKNVANEDFSNGNSNEVKSLQPGQVHDLVVPPLPQDQHPPTEEGTTLAASSDGDIESHDTEVVSGDLTLRTTNRDLFLGKASQYGLQKQEPKIQLSQTQSPFTDNAGTFATSDEEYDGKDDKTIFSRTSASFTSTEDIMERPLARDSLLSSDKGAFLQVPTKGRRKQYIGRKRLISRTRDGTSFPEASKRQPGNHRRRPHNHPPSSDEDISLAASDEENNDNKDKEIGSENSGSFVTTSTRNGGVKEPPGPPGGQSTATQSSPGSFENSESEDLGSGNSTEDGVKSPVVEDNGSAESIFFMSSPNSSVKSNRKVPPPLPYDQSPSSDDDTFPVASTEDSNDHEDDDTDNRKSASSKASQEDIEEQLSTLPLQLPLDQSLSTDGYTFLAALDEENNGNVEKHTGKEKISSATVSSSVERTSREFFKLEIDPSASAMTLPPRLQTSSFSHFSSDQPDLIISPTTAPSAEDQLMSSSDKTITEEFVQDSVNATVKENTEQLPFEESTENTVSDVHLPEKNTQAEPSNDLATSSVPPTDSVGNQSDGSKHKRGKKAKFPIFPPTGIQDKDTGKERHEKNDFRSPPTLNVGKLMETTPTTAATPPEDPVMSDQFLMQTMSLLARHTAEEREKEKEKPKKAMSRSTSGLPTRCGLPVHMWLLLSVTQCLVWMCTF